ncbi:MAG: superoxide dismutase [Ni] [Planctomycetota bacterium]
MKSLLPAALFATALLPGSFAAAHCQVPCGIYGDQRRFEEMLEDTETVAKAIANISELASTHDANGHNQLGRWIANKESHATNIQTTIGEYFLAQRVKASNPKYVEQLKACHAVIVAAMKAKQAADPATADVLKEAILDLYRAYEGKEPTMGRATPRSPAQEYVIQRDLGKLVSNHVHDR